MWKEEFAKEAAEEAAEHRNMDEFYIFTQILSEKRKTPQKPVRD